MASFIIRVELRDTESNHPDYTRLHTAMKDGKFYRNLVPHGMVRLPHAEYHCERDATANQILSEVCGIASAIKIRPRVLVTEAAKIVHHGLMPLRAATVLQRASARVAAKRIRVLRTAFGS